MTEILCALIKAVQIGEVDKAVHSISLKTGKI